jgi:hypothetical protein
MNSLTAELMSADAVRRRCSLILQAADNNQTRHFRFVPGRLEDVVRRVVQVTRRRYRSLEVPYHSRWRHFEAGGTNRQNLVTSRETDCHESARRMVDLAVVSVLLDAGAGPTWKYTEVETGQCFSRSEGLAVASFRAMEAGLFSSDPDNLWQADATALCGLEVTSLATALQCSSNNVLVGLDGRTELLHRLGAVVAESPEVFGASPRVGNLYDNLRKGGTTVEAADILGTLITTLNPMWQGPGRIALDGVFLGDCGRHSLIPGDGLVPFHKLLQWLAYSLLEPLEQAGVIVAGLDRLTGLAEYRNGGLFVDAGVLEPLDPDLKQHPLDPASEPVVEWRALTVALLDRIHPLVCRQLGLTELEFPLAKVLEGGTWAAGRELAYERRTDGSPPLAIRSDGTWF